MATVASRSAVAVSCPACTTQARPVAALTVRSLVKQGLADEVGDGPYWFCPSPACDVVYYGEGEPGRRFLRSDLRVRVGVKEAAPPIPVCYCFDWTVADLECELRLTGATTIPERVREKIRQGLCRCETMNPQGVCCLAEVNRTAKEAQARLSAAGATSPGPGRDQAHGAPGGVAAARPRARGAWTATLGAVLTAILGSACCWLPLLLIALGFSAAGVGGFFEQYRPYLLTATFALLGVAWYLTYRPALRRAWARVQGRPVSAPKALSCCATGPADAGAACGAPQPQEVGGRPGRRFTLRRFNELMLWAATLVVLLIALFPSWSGLVFRGGAAPTAAPDGSRRIVLDIQGMTCEGCVAAVRQALSQVPGVDHVEVDYGRSEAVVSVRPGSAVRSEGLRRALEDAGFHGRIKGE